MIKGLSFLGRGLFAAGRELLGVGASAFLKNVVEETSSLLGSSIIPSKSVAENLALALDFYTTHGGYSIEGAMEWLRGIDFSQPVKIIILSKNTKVVQYMLLDRYVGNYFVPVGTTS